MGLDGKTLIHPTQIDICNETFTGACDEVERAQPRSSRLCRCRKTLAGA